MSYPSLAAHQSIIDRVMNQVDQARLGVSFSGAYSGPDAICRRDALLAERAAASQGSKPTCKPVALPDDYMFTQAAEGRQYFIERTQRAESRAPFLRSV